MNVWTRSPAGPFVIVPEQRLVAGGPAEALEERIQTAFTSGHASVAIDLRNVTTLDSTGVRALIRGYSTAQRRGATFVLYSPSETARRVLHVARLDSVFAIVDTLAASRVKRQSSGPIQLVIGGVLIVLSLIWGGLRWPAFQTPGGAAEIGRALESATTHTNGATPLVDLAKLVAAAAIGMLVTAVQRHSHHEKSHTQSIEHTQVLLCVAGAMIMIIIGSSLARAFGVAGAASIIRFRTPIDDPKDITVLFLLMTLGMATGLGAFALAGIGAAFLCLFILVLDHFGVHRPRTMIVHLKSSAGQFPTGIIEGVFARNHVAFELREISQGNARYHTTLNPTVSLEELSEELMTSEGSAIKSVEWEPSRKSD